VPKHLKEKGKEEEEEEQRGGVRGAELPSRRLGGGGVGKIR